MRNLSAKWVPKCLNADQKRQRCQSSEQILEFFRRDWWPWTKPGYITMAQRQSNNQWSGGIAAHSAPRNSVCKNPLEKFSPQVLGSRLHPPHRLSSDEPNYQRVVLLISAGAIEGLLKGKRRGKVTKGSCSCTTMPRLTRHLQPRRNWPTWASNVLISHPILWAPSDYHLFPGLKKQLKGSHFSSEAEIIATWETWLDGQPSEFFLSGLQKLEQDAYWTSWECVK